jgi:hypothetical protein
LRFWPTRLRKRQGLLPWRRNELQAQLKAGAIARGEAITRKRCDYLIDKALATGVLDSSGELKFNMRGSREEIIAGILERCAVWNMPITRVRAEHITDRALRDIRRRQCSWIMWIAILSILAVTILVAIIAVIQSVDSSAGET